MKVRKAIIPAAGFGTRFLPATKAQPKEMLPIIDKPTVQYIVEEAVASGIEEIAIITTKDKKPIEDHFDRSDRLESLLMEKQKTEQLEMIKQISELAKIHYIRQKEPLGLGDAILTAKDFIGNEPFAVLLGDDIVRANKPCLKQLIDVFEYWNSTVIGVQQVQQEEVSKYGIIKPKDNIFGNQLLFVDGLIEKPSPHEAPSNYAIMGRYILVPSIFDHLQKIPLGKGNELQLTDAINELNKEKAVLAYRFEGKRFDIGDKIGFIKATIDFALERDDTKEEILAFINEIKSKKGRDSK